jgi:hypothetical protein
MIRALHQQEAAGSWRDKGHGWLASRLRARFSTRRVRFNSQEAAIMSIDWSSVLQTLTATTVLAAAIAWLAKTLITHFLDRNLRNTEAALHDATEKELVRLKAATDTELETLRIQASHALESYRAQVAAAESKRARIASEVVTWSNPVLEAVDNLDGCLKNILENDAFCLLSKIPICQLNRNWSITHETFMPNALYQFSRYFCRVGLLNEALSYELFESKQDRDQFFSKIWAVSRALSGFPHRELPELCSQQTQDEPVDAQMMGSEQASLGGAIRVSSDGKVRCLPYAEFLQKLDEDDPVLCKQIAPLRRFLEGINPNSVCRWHRLRLMRQGLIELKEHWESLLDQSLAAEAPMRDDPVTQQGGEKDSRPVPH